MGREMEVNLNEEITQDGPPNSVLTLTKERTNT